MTEATPAATATSGPTLAERIPWQLAILALALVAVFLLFTAIVGVQESSRVQAANAKQLEQSPDHATLELPDPTEEGWKAAMRFASVGNISTILRQTSIVGLAALGMTLIIISGGIDLSVGSMIALSTVAIAWVLQSGAVEGPDGVTTVPLAYSILALVAGVAIAAGCGLFNGSVIAGLGVTPFIVTLGSLLMVRGLAKGLAGEQKIDAPLTWLNELVARLPPDMKWMIVPPGVWIMLVMTGVVLALLHLTRFGRYVFAIGSNEQTARLCGIAVWRIKLMVYALGGTMAGMAGLMQFSRLTVGDPTVAFGLELDVIAAVVIGGGSLSGGEGSVIGSLLGALIMTVIRAGCAQVGLDNWVQEIVTGGIIVVAVALDRFRHARAT